MAALRVRALSRLHMKFPDPSIYSARSMPRNAANVDLTQDCYLSRRTRNSDFESIYGMLQQKEDEVKALTQQVRAGPFNACDTLL